MQQRSYASLVYRINSQVLVLSVALSALVVPTLPDLTASLLFRGFVIFAILFVFLTTVWRQLGNMSNVGILGGESNYFLGFFLSFLLVLFPGQLRLLLGPAEQLRLIAAIALPVSLGLTEALLALMIRRAKAYQTKRQWRLFHHSLWFASALFFLSLLIPISVTTLAAVPLRAVSWLVIIVLPPIVRRFGSGFVATPAQPPKLRVAKPAASSGSTPRAENVTGESSENGHPRKRSRRGSGRQRRYGGSRRRM